MRLASTTRRNARRETRQHQARGRRVTLFCQQASRGGEQWGAFTASEGTSRGGKGEKRGERRERMG